MTHDDPRGSYARERNIFVQCEPHYLPLIVDRGHTFEDTRHFLAAPDGRIEEIDDAAKARGAIPILEIEQLFW